MQDQDQPVVNIASERVALGPIGVEAIEAVHRWWNDFSIARNLHSAPKPKTMAQIAAMFEPGGFFNKPTTVAFAIRDAADGELIGTAGLMEIEHDHGAAEFFIVIGDATRHGQGLGTETAKLVLSYGFVTLGLANIMLRVSEFNGGAIRSYQKAGFAEFGRRSRCHAVDGRRWATIYMEALNPAHASQT
jgi:RimJ/RimL family protein N-acetyltransferase